LAGPSSKWFEWSANVLEQLDDENQFVINPIIYAGCSIAYDTIEEIEEVFFTLDFEYKNLPREALFLAGRAFNQYR
jgi:hypothetical protein